VKGAGRKFFRRVAPKKMERRNDMKKAFLLTLLAWLALTSAALAQAPPPPPPGGPGGPPPEVVLKDFLDFTDAQAASFQVMLETRQQAVQAILPQLDASEVALGDALKGSSPDPTQLGTLLLAVHGFKGQIRQAEETMAAGFNSLLTDAQKAKVAEILALAKALPALDAMRQLHLLPPPAGGPGGGTCRGSRPPDPAPVQPSNR
jgi:hypothetical protein